MRRSYRHWTPRYVRDRLLLWQFERSHPDAPWLTADAIRLLDQLLLPTDIGFEFGSGRSTRWLAQRLARLSSVESDPAWHEKVAAELASAGCGNVEYLFRTQGADYAAGVDAVRPASLNFCLIDGIDRDRCTARSLPKLAPGALLVIDDVHRYVPRDPVSTSPGARRPESGFATPLWEESWRQLSGWRRIWTSNGVKDTAIFFRPC